MTGYTYQDNKGTFILRQPEDTGYLYFPLASENGMRSSVTPLLGGDAKADQNHFLLLPVSAEELHNSRSTRNFWCRIEGQGVWSATGASASQAASRAMGEGETSQLTAGLMWQRIRRENKNFGLTSEILNFVPLGSCKAEIMLVTLINSGSRPVTVKPYGAVPIYGRSADNLRDHRHVTSLLHRIRTTENSVLVRPTLSFDERGHQLNHTTYFVSGLTEQGKSPAAFFPTVESFIGEGGSYDCPRAVYGDWEGVDAGTVIAGFEAMGAMVFESIELKPGQETSYILLMGLTEEEEQEQEALTRFGTKEKVLRALEETKDYWEDKVNVEYRTGDKDFNCFMHWVSFQPILRRIYGCSFLPHHDYGRGGRGWRDLWQDCLALLLMNPEGVKDMLLANFGGVRMDGTNATIIGSGQGEFIADRNNITRVWMDHGLWPLITTKQYIDQTGDFSFLLEENTYFKDKQVCRGTRTDFEFEQGSAPTQKDIYGQEYLGSILEHLLVQNLTAFYEVGEHNHIRLRGADWNDALDMAAERGESVAFTAAYAGNLEQLAELILQLARETKLPAVELAQEMEALFTDEETLYESVEAKQKLLEEYCETCAHPVSGQKCSIPVKKAAESLQHKADWIRRHIRETEWIADGEDGWFNSYYDNHGRQAEGIFEEKVRMMLTGQVFAIMSETALEEQVGKIVRSADRYLYSKAVGGYRLNTDFGELKTDLGRMFGFAYGQKENGAVFSHMTAMYANALYQRGFAREGYKALDTLYRQAANYEVSRIYPGIPEYFDGKGRGMYHYLTGAASWYMLTVIQEMYGIKGDCGALCITPRLMAEQFDEEGRAEISLLWGGCRWHFVFVNNKHREYGEYKVEKVYLDGSRVEYKGRCILSAEKISCLDRSVRHELLAELS